MHHKKLYAGLVLTTLLLGGIALASTPGLDTIEGVKQRIVELKQELADLQNVAPSTGMGAQCKMLNSNQSGNRYTYTMQCDQPKLTSSVEFVFGATSYQGNINSEIDDPGLGKMQIAQQFNARRIGDSK